MCAYALISQNARTYPALVDSLTLTGRVALLLRPQRFIDDRRALSERLVQPPRVVPALDELEQRPLAVGVGAQRGALELLALERGEEELSARALSKQSPALPHDGRTPPRASARRCQRRYELSALGDITRRC